MLVSTWLSNKAFHCKLCLWSANFVCDQFKIMPGIISKLLCTAIWSCHAVWLESEHMPFSLTGLLLCTGFRSAALHTISFRSCGSVPVLCLLRVQWMIIRLSKEMSAALVSNSLWTSSCQFHQKFHFTWIKKVACHCPKFTKHSILFYSWRLELSQYLQSGYLW